MRRQDHQKGTLEEGNRIEGFKTAVQGISTLLNRCAIGLLLLLTFLTLGDILLRKFFNRGILGALELSEFLMTTIVFFSLAQGEILQRNVNFNLAVNRLPVRVRRRIHLLTQFVFTCFFGLIAGAVVVYGRSMQAVGEVSPDLLIPKYPFIYVTASGCAMLALVLLVQFLSALVERRRP
jgi:TRAP-type C4-dicarboxylate transport system permease small subunit